jgi:hypothetical protein
MHPGTSRPEVGNMHPFLTKMSKRGPLAQKLETCVHECYPWRSHRSWKHACTSAILGSYFFVGQVVSGYRRPIPEWWPPPVAQLVSKCWHQDSFMRPSATQVGAAIWQLLSVCISVCLSVCLSSCSPRPRMWAQPHGSCRLSVYLSLSVSLPASKGVRRAHGRDDTLRFCPSIRCAKRSRP